MENYGPPLVREDALDHYRAAGLDPVAYRLVRLKLPAPGTPDRSRDLARLRRQGVEYVVIELRGARPRARRARRTTRTIVDFYEELDAQAELVKEFRPGAGRARAGAQALPARSAGRSAVAPQLAPGRQLAGASPAAASTSPSVIGRRPGRTIA